MKQRTFPECAAIYPHLAFADAGSTSTNGSNGLNKARAFAALMIPHEPGGSLFWSNAARWVLIASLVELQHEKPEAWGFADLSEKLSRPIEELADAARIHFPEALIALFDGQQNVTSDSILAHMMIHLSVVFDLARVDQLREAAGKEGGA